MKLSSKWHAFGFERSTHGHHVWIEENGTVTHPWTACCECGFDSRDIKKSSEAAALIMKHAREKHSS